jgi:hypothetical protein
MTIASSSFVVDALPQKDGRVWITETHVDATVGPLTFAYLAANGSNATTVMNARVAQINAGLADAEFEKIVSNGA